MRRNKDEPNKLYAADIVKFSDDPLVGALVLNTEKGVIDMGINRLSAETLLKALRDFLAVGDNDNRE